MIFIGINALKGDINETLPHFKKLIVYKFWQLQVKDVTLQRIKSSIVMTAMQIKESCMIVNNLAFDKDIP